MNQDDIPHHPVETTSTTFESLGLSPDVLASVQHIGFEHPTPIQEKVIPPALEGRDIIGLAETGSGKTAAFCLPLADRLEHGKGTRALILSPTREIALQTKAFLDLFGENHRIETVCLIGGVKFKPQIDGLKKKPDIIVATPGRLLDHVKRQNARVDQISELVLDEADHMLDLGFLPQVRQILKHLPTERHTMLFSATMPEAIESLARSILRDPQRVDVSPVGRTAKGITHRLYLVSQEDKRACLLALLEQELGSTLVFVRRKVDAEWLYAILQRKGHPVERIHSDLTQKGRVKALKTFREGEHRILVATGIAGRGIDIPGIEHVIHFDMPETVEDYIHRGGRTARGDAVGLVSSIGTFFDIKTVREIEKSIGESIPRCSVPGVKQWIELAPKSRSRRRV